MALAPLAYVLYRRVLRHNPANPNWPNRDRFILSAGHACDPPVRRPPPDRLQPLARGAEALPPVGVEDAGPSGALRHRGRRDDHRPARPGLRERRRLRDRRALPRRALQPAPRRDRRPLRLRDLLRRRPDGGRLLRGGVDRRPPRPRQARLLLRRQPHHDRRHDRRSRSRPRTRRSASRRRAGTSSRSTTRRTSTRSSARSRAAQAVDGRAVADHRPQPHRLRRAERGRHREVARRAARRGRGARDEGGARARPRQALRRRPTRSTSTWTCARGDRARAGVEAAASSAGRRRSRRCARTGTQVHTGKPRPGWVEALPEFPAGEEVATPRRRQEGDAGVQAASRRR